MRKPSPRCGRTPIAGASCSVMLSSVRSWWGSWLRRWPGCRSKTRTGRWHRTGGSFTTSDGSMLWVPWGGPIKYAHPPAAQPRHRELARLILWWKARLPGTTIRLSKLDVDSAYKVIWLCIPDVGLFATELPGGAVGWDGPVLVLYLVLTFGWGGSPGG